MKNYYKQIQEGLEVRSALIAIRAEKEPQKRRELQKLYGENPQVLLNCLRQEDPKVRKNAALILGELEREQEREQEREHGTEAAAEHLWEAYRQEEQLFIRPDYLKALSAFDLGPYLKELKDREKELEGQLLGKSGKTEGQGSEKHLRQELEELRRILLSYEKPEFHTFKAPKAPVDVLLLTNKGCETLTADQIQEGRVRPVKGGVLAEQAELSRLLSIRTYRELLFCLKGSRRMKRESLAEELLDTDLSKLLQDLLEGEGPYYFRLAVKGPMSLEERSVFCKKLAARLEELSEGNLKNAPSSYEVELRLTENRDGTFYPLVKLQALPDKRFAYRKYSVAASVAPVQAAICMELAAPYLKEQAQVLDPFCGVGTMLLERNYKLHANTLYGIDLYAPAIQGARENAQIAGVPAHFINRDSLTFVHSYLFDEIVTNFPVKGKTKDAHAIDCLYGQFLDKAGELLKPEGVILLYSHDRGYVKKHLRMRPEWKLKQEWCVSEKEGAYLFCIQRRTIPD